MYELTIPAMSCGHCQKTITGAVLAVDGNASLNFDMTAHKVTVTSVATLVEISEAVEASGYPVEQAAQHSGHGAEGHHCDMCD
jgi:copper chaperone